MKLDDIIEIEDLVRISAASKILGISKATVRNWSNSGKLWCTRHPINNYRLFYKKDLEELIWRLKGRQ